MAKMDWWNRNFGSTYIYGLITYDNFSQTYLAKAMQDLIAMEDSNQTFACSEHLFDNTKHVSDISLVSQPVDQWGSSLGWNKPPTLGIFRPSLVT